MPANLSAEQVSVFVILIVAFGLLITERLRNDIVALLIVLSLYLTRVLQPKDALSGFSSEPAIVVAGIFVMSGALFQTGLSDRIGHWVGRLAGTSLTRAIAVIMPSVAVMSAFTHHVTTTAVMLPVTMDLSKERALPPSKLLMPLAFAASLGTTITIIGAPAFLIASDILRRNGRAGLGVFSIAPVGIALSLAGTAFMLVAGRWLLPERRGAEGGSERFRLDEYFTELTILPDSPYLGKTVAEAEADDKYAFKVAGWLRGGRRLRPLPQARLEAGDVLLVRTTPEEIVAIRQNPGVELHPVAQYGTDGTKPGEDQDIADALVQAVVAPNSDLAGRTLGDIDFRRRYGAIVVGLWRQGGFAREELARTRLHAGDVLVLQGDEEALARVASDRAFLMMVPFQGEARQRRKATLSGLIMLATVVAAATNLMTIEMAALAGAVAMVLTGCVTGRQAYRAIDARIFVFIAGAIPLGAAMEKSGVSQKMAGWLQHAVGGWNQFFVLLALYAIVAVLTQFMSDSATTALFAPVAVALAQALGQAPEPYVVTVAMASVVAFLTPIGHHGNLLVYGPGGYRFADFVRVGAPLTVLCGLVVTLLAPLVWRG